MAECGDSKLHQIYPDDKQVHFKKISEVLLSAVCCLLSAVWCLLSAVGYLLFAVHNFCQ
jgi:hypothetical protein